MSTSRGSRTRAAQRFYRALLHLYPAGFLAEYRDETPFDKALAAAAIVLTLAGFALALWTAFAG